MSKVIAARGDRVRGVIKELEHFYRSTEFGPIHSEEGKILKILIELSGAKSILEIGTSIGFSGLWISLGIMQTGGELITLEVDPRLAKIAKDNFRRAGITDIVTLLEGNAFDVLPLPKKDFDFVFLDSTKNEYWDLFNLFFDSVKEKGIIVAHDTNCEREKMGIYLEGIKNHPGLDTVMTFTYDDKLRDIISTGMAISYKKIASR